MRILCFLSAFSLFIFGLVGCQSVLESPSGPLLGISWDTTVQYKQFIIGGDSLHIVVDLSSQTESNRIFSMGQRKPFSTLFEFLGPDTDWDLQFQKDLFGKKIKKSIYSFRIPDGLRPGIYTISSWAVDGENRKTDTARFQFVLSNGRYPVLAINSPTNVNSPILLSLDSSSNREKIKLSVAAGSSIPGGFVYQWFDSLGNSELSEPIPLISKPREGGFSCDTLLFLPELFGKKFKMKVAFETIESRKMEYTLSLYRN